MAPSRRPKKQLAVSHRQVHAFADRLFGEDMHAARIGALANSVTGLLEAGQLAEPSPHSPTTPTSMLKTG